MKKIDLGQALAILANVGVIASIVFLGLQMQQSRQIAQSDLWYQEVALQISANDAIAQHPEIWARGNAGEQLEPHELAVFEGQVQNLNWLWYFRHQMDLQMGQDVSASIRVVEFARYLKDNPGGYQAWLDHERSMERDRRSVNPSQSFAEDWIELVHSAMDAIVPSEAL